VSKSVFYADKQGKWKLSGLKVKSSFFEYIKPATLHTAVAITLKIHCNDKWHM
jgi:hypothetical protein